MLYSPSTKGFYIAAVHGVAIPADAVQIDDAHYAALMSAQAAGQVIVPGPSGAPVAVDPSTLLTLDQVKAQKISELTSAANAAIGGLVSYKNTQFQADEAVSQSRLKGVLTAYTAATLPANFYWVDAGNNQVPMTYADLQGLAAAMANQGWPAFERLQTLKAQVNAAADIASINAVSW